jgi:3-deoxy-manno-octulosonate cytidylyltransferase (CMP-KDO synthetase)
MVPLREDEDPRNVNIPKVAVTEDSRLVYMSRAVIPASKSDVRSYIIYKQVCIYAFSGRELDLFGRFGRKGYLEGIEDIEILRFFDLGVPVRMIKVSAVSQAVDIPEDVELVKKIMIRSSHGKTEKI